MDVRRWRTALGACLLTASPCVLAQGGMTLVEPSPRQRDTVPPVQAPGFLKEKETPFRLPEVPAAPPVQEAVQGMVLQRVTFRGNRAVPTAVLDEVARPWIGLTVDAAAVENLRQQLTRAYIERGYINSGLLLAPAEAQQPGVVVFDVVEGTLSAVRIAGNGRLKESYIRDRLSPDPTETLNLDALRERYQLLLNDPLIARMNARLLPGPQPGTAILDVEVTRHRPWDTSVFVDNYRSPVIGSLERGVSGAVRNLTGYGDLLEGTVTESPQERSSVRGEVAWRMPLNAHGTDLTLRYEEGQSTVIEKPLDELEIDSLYENRTVELGQVLYESLRHKLSLGLGHTERENETYLLGEPFSFIQGQSDGEYESSSTRFWQEYTWRSSRQVLALRSTFSEVDSGRDEDSNVAGATSADSTYDTWTGQFVYVHRVMDNGAQVSLRGTLQDSDTGLLPTDDFVLGGVSTVRGYRENQFTFDEGHLLNLEFEYPLRKAGREGLSLTLRPFVDYGRGMNVDGDPDTISSTGLALDASWHGLEANLVYAERLSHPEWADDLDDDWQDRGVHFRVAYRF